MRAATIAFSLRHLADMLGLPDDADVLDIRILNKHFGDRAEVQVDIRGDDMPKQLPREEMMLIHALSYWSAVQELKRDGGG